MLEDGPIAEALDWLILLDGADEACRARFDAWLAASTDNLAAFQKAQAIWQSPLLTEAARRLDASPQPATRPPRQRLKPLAMAAALLLAVGVGLQSDLLLRLRADHLTQVGERQNLHLADGSRVLLNTDSAISSRIDEQQRVARLYRGEAYFDVTHDRNRPFEVEAGPVQVSVRGTAFAVRYLGDAAEVSVRHGSVDVSSRQDSARVSLGAGDSIRIGPDGFSDLRHANLEQELAWVRGRLVFENCPLSQVLAELRRYYPGWIYSANEQLEAVKVTGNYRLDDPVGVVRSLAQVTSAQLHEYPSLLILN
nr:FecR domain-containing protein [Pseudomonas sp. TCU-HL1]